MVSLYLSIFVAPVICLVTLQSLKTDDIRINFNPNRLPIWFNSNSALFNGIPLFISMITFYFNDFVEFKRVEFYIWPAGRTGVHAFSTETGPRARLDFISIIFIVECNRVEFYIWPAGRTGVHAFSTENRPAGQVRLHMRPAGQVCVGFKPGLVRPAGQFFFLTNPWYNQLWL